MQIVVQLVIIITYVITPNNGVKEKSQDLFDLESSNFSKIVNTSTFVDKTLIINVIFEEKPIVLITARRHFGKSTNIDMLKKFLEIQVDEEGKPKTPIENTDNYALFIKNKLKITENLKIVNDHFGKFPVIHVDFECDSAIQSFKDVLKFCKKVIHSSYKQHAYLIQSEKLTSQERHLIEQWCDEDMFEDFEDIDISLGLKILSEMLCTHFDGKNSFALIDNYDSLLLSSNHKRMPKQEQDIIFKFFIGLMSNLLKVNPHLGRAVITGTSYWAGNSKFLSGLDKFVSHFVFLGDHVFVDYFGLTRDEVDDLFDKFGLGTNLSYTISGYRSKSGNYIYGYNFVLKTLQSRFVKN